MRTSFLDYYKVVLSKVSFDQSLLNKEYCKALQMLSEPEAKELSDWMSAMKLDVFQQQMPAKNIA